ncbi:MAG TPA: glycoside hydrolase family 18 protein [Longimicrobium sp.]|nr:glycoside hydrolase family 18 protein [Longimicrobium sp.]
MSTTTQMVNAWLFINGENPTGVGYSDPGSSYQALLQNDVYQSIDVLFLAFFTTVPVGDGTYTIEIGGGVQSTVDLVQYVINSARQNNPDIRIVATLGYGSGTNISKIFPDPDNPDAASAEAFAANLVAYLQASGLNGLDLDWESPISGDTTQEQFATFVNAVGKAFAQQPQKYYLTISPAVATNLDAAAVNANVDFVNLQLYSGFTFPRDFTRLGINASLFAYGAAFANGTQTAQGAFDDNNAKYGYPIYTVWQMNPADFAYAQAQQKELYALVLQPSSASATAAAPAAAVPA